MAVVYDQSHGEPKLEEYYSSFSRSMTSRGYRVDVLNAKPLNLDELKGYKVLMISFPQKKFSDEEIKGIINFVGDGGGLFVVGEEGNWGGFKEILNSLSKEFGITFNDDEVHDPTDSVGESYSVIHTMKEHPVLNEVEKFVIYGGCSLNVSGDAEAIATGDDDTFSTKDYYKAGDYPPVLAVSEYLDGRVLCIGDGSLFRNRFINEFYNKQLALNIIEWLSRGKKAGAEAEEYTKEDILNEIDEIEKKYTQLRDDYSEGKINEDEYRGKIAEYGERLEELEKMLAELE
ncbi:MAG: DUF4350 domain-containing protein [Candidatus Hydrothermarchaeales archaeon]